VTQTEQAEREFEQGFFGPDDVFVLNSRLPVEIGKLSDLKLFHLPKNHKTSGMLSVFSPLAKLESLNLEGNAFTGDISALAVDAHPNLALLNVAYNDIKGNLPTSLVQLNNLTTLVLEGNGLSGQIPTEMGLAPKLGKVTELLMISPVAISSDNLVCDRNLEFAK
jgi:hypothetical protein